MVIFSFFSLPFVTQMPVVAHDNFGIQPNSTAYGLLYACLGAGAVVGSLSIGTVFVNISKRKIARVGFAEAPAGFAVARTE